MKMYLSSYELGNETDKLREMMPANNRCGCIFNALDFTGADPERKSKRVERTLQELNELSFDSFDLDLKNYFSKQDELRKLVDTLGAVWVIGGNVFVLRQAFKLSGFDTILLDLTRKDDFLYGAYSAGVCVLSPTLVGYNLTDDATDTPFEGQNEVLWDGLGIIDFMFVPHYKSDHAESDGAEKEVDYFEEKGASYRTLRDGEVIIIEK